MNSLMNVQSAYDLHRAGRYADAARGYQVLLDRDPDDADVLHLFGVMHHQCGHSARGAELTGRAIAFRPNVAAYHANLAEIQRALGQHKEAAESCRTALRLRPDYPEALNNLGLALYELGQHEEALAQYDAVLALRPDFALAQNNRGNALRALGKTAEAIEAFRAAISFASRKGAMLSRAELAGPSASNSPRESMPPIPRTRRWGGRTPASGNSWRTRGSWPLG